MINTVEKIYQDTPSGDIQIIYKITYSDNKSWFCNEDEENRHYQEILEWVAEGNTITDNGGGE